MDAANRHTEAASHASRRRHAGHNRPRVIVYFRYGCFYLALNTPATAQQRFSSHFFSRFISELLNEYEIPHH